MRALLGGSRLPGWLMLTWLGLLVCFGRVWEGSENADPVRYQQVAREMARAGDWITPRLGGEPYFNKPPLLFWLTALSLRVLGEHQAVYHLWPGLAGIACLLLCYFLCRRLWDEQTGLIGALVLGTFVLFIRSAREVRFTVPLLALFLAAALLAVHPDPRRRHRIGFWAVTAAAFLLMGPMGLMSVPVAGLFGLFSRQAKLLRGRTFWVAGPLLFSGLVLPWVVAMLALHGRTWSEGVLEEVGSRFSGAVAGQPGVASFYLEKLAAYGWPWLALTPFVAWVGWRRIRKGGIKCGSRLAAAWTLCFGALLLSVRPPYARYALPLLVPWALATGRALRLHLPERWLQGLPAALPAALAAGSLFLAIVPIPVARDRARDALRMRPWIQEQTSSDRKLAYYQADLNERRAALDSRLGRPATEQEILRKVLWKDRDRFLFYLDREMAPLATPAEVAALDPGTTFLASRKNGAGLEDGGRMEVLFEGREWLLLRKLPDPCTAVPAGDDGSIHGLWRVGGTMSSILEKVYPARQELAARGAEIQRKVDQGALAPGKANQALAEVLCTEMVNSLGPAGPACFSVWLRGSSPGAMPLAGWADSDKLLAPRAVWLGERPGRVLSTRRPLVLQEPTPVRLLGAEILEEGATVPASWQTAALVPVEKAGEALGLALAFFPRPLAPPDFEGLMRMADQLGSLLLTGAEGLPELP